MEERVRAPARVGHRIELVAVEGERLLDPDMLAGLERAPGQLGVRGVAGGDDDRVAEAREARAY